MVNNLIRVAWAHGNVSEESQGRGHKLTFADARSVHHPDEGGAELAISGDAVLGRFEDMAIVFLYLLEEKKRDEEKTYTKVKKKKKNE